MTMYVEIFFEPAAPIADPGVDNNCCIIGKVTSFPGEDRLVIANTLTELEAQGIEEANGGILWKAAADFFAANGLTPRASKLYAYAVDDAAAAVTIERETMSGLIDGTNTTFHTMASPVDNLSVEIQWEEGGPYITQEKDVSYVAQTMAPGSSKLSGEIELVDNQLIVTPSGVGIEPTYAAIADMGPAGEYPGAKIVANYEVSGISKILRELRAEDITMFTFAFDETPLGMLDAYSDGWLMDMFIGAREAAISAQAGKPRMFFFALPQGVKASDTIPSNLRGGISAVDYGELGNVLGNRYTAAIAHNGLDVDGVLLNNVGGAYMGTAAGQFPLKRGLTLQRLPIAQVRYPLQGEIDKFTTAKIATILNIPDLYPTENLISFGFTFGTGTEARIENIRCKMKIARELRAVVFDFIRSKTNYVDASGCRALNAAITALFERMQNQGVCDGLKSIENPLLDKFEKAAKSAADKEYITFYVQRNWIPDVRITYLWRGNVEFINLFVREAAV